MSGMTRRNAMLLGALAPVLGFASRARADDWPSRPVTIISPYPAGGGSDIIARTVAKELGTALGQSFVVENRSGSAGNIGAVAVANARPDGYTMMIGGSSPIAANKLIYRKLSYDPERDFTPLSLVAAAPLLFSSHPSLPARTLQEVIEYVKARPGQVACANAGNGSKGHMALLMLCHLTGMQLNHIPFRGSAPAQSALLAATVPLCIDTASVYIPHVQSGELRGVAVTSTQRMSLIPDVPTVAEQGIPGFDATVWYGAVGPAGLPPKIAPRIAEIVDRWGRSSEGNAMLTRLGMIALGGTPDDLAQAVKREFEVWGPIVKEAGIVVE